jgi:hypothetical protein
MQAFGTFKIFNDYYINDYIDQRLYRFDENGFMERLTLKRQNAYNSEFDLNIDKEFEKVVFDLASIILNEAKKKYTSFVTTKFIISGIKIFLLKTKDSALVFINAMYTSTNRQIWCYSLHGGKRNSRYIARTSIPIRNISEKIDFFFESITYLETIISITICPENDSYAVVVTQDLDNEFKFYRLKISNF